MGLPVTSVAVKDFQSIADADVDLGRFTVLVGPSNSGKSAFLRASRACLRNTFVPANVRSGSLKSVITINLENAEPVTIERGKSLSTYILGTEKYTKANRQVPEPVLKAIGMPPIEGTDLNFSFQFDRPFLLAETGSHAAQVVGSLTNVTLLHEAVREANRRRQDAAQRLRMRQGDVDCYLEQSKQFADLPDEQKRLESYTAELDRLYDLDFHLSRLKELVYDYKEHQSQIIDPGPEPPELNVETAQQKLAQLQSLRSLVKTVRDRHWEVRQLISRAQSLKSAVEQNEEEYQRVLHEMGVCPVCGSKT